MLNWSLRYALVIIGSALVVGVLHPRSEPGETSGRSIHIAGRDGPEAPAADRDPHLWKTVRSGPGGHFFLDGVVDGEPVRFLIDTGASHLILSPADASRIGLTGDRLEYSLRYATANGIVSAAPVRLRELRIDQRSLYDVEAVVNAAPLGVSLLGISLLSDLGSYTIRGDRLEFYW